MVSSRGFPGFEALTPPKTPARTAGTSRRIHSVTGVCGAIACAQEGSAAAAHLRGSGTQRCSSAMELHCHGGPRRAPLLNETTRDGSRKQPGTCLGAGSSRVRWLQQDLLLALLL